MKKILKLSTLVLLLALLFSPASTVHAHGNTRGLLDGQVVFGDDFTLKSGDSLNGDLVVFGGNVTIEEDAKVNGDMVVFGGNVILDGRVNGSVVIIGGSTTMGDTSSVRGDLVTIGGGLTRDPGAEIEGEVVTNVPAPNIPIPNIPSPPTAPDVPGPPDIQFNYNPMGDFLNMLGTTIAVSLLAVLASLFLQPQIERVSQAIIGSTVISGSVGLLAIVAAVIAIPILAVTIILIPVALLVALVVPFAWLFGMIAIGTEVGERFSRAINQTWAAPLAAGMGTFLMMLVVGGVGMVPCIGWLAYALVALIGIGGVVLTIFGSQPYPRVLPPVAVPDSEPQE